MSCCVPLFHSFIILITGMGSTWWSLARSSSTLILTQSGRKEPLKPTKASLSGGERKRRKIKAVGPHS